MYPAPKRCLLALLAIGLTATSAACGDDGKGQTDAGVDLVTDSAPPDAPVAECTMTMCGDRCVDTSTDSLHCGGCDQACDSPGQICSGSLPCACPDPFLTGTVAPSGFDQVLDQMGFKVALAPQIGSVLNIFAVIYEPGEKIGEPIDLAAAVATLSPPAVAAGYDVDFMTMNAKTAYAPTSGTLTLSTACQDGVSGTIDNVTFSEVGGVFDPTPVAGGCSFFLDSLDFEIGSSCMDMDGGVDGDAGL